MKKRTGQSLLCCWLISFLGIMVNISHNLADQIITSLRRLTTQAGILISLHALSVLCSVLLSSPNDRFEKYRVIAAALSVMAARLLNVPAFQAFVPILR